MKKTALVIVLLLVSVVAFIIYFFSLNGRREDCEYPELSITVIDQSTGAPVGGAILWYQRVFHLMEPPLFSGDGTPPFYSNGVLFGGSAGRFALPVQIVERHPCCFPRDTYITVIKPGYFIKEENVQEIRNRNIDPSGMTIELTQKSANANPEDSWQSDQILNRLAGLKEQPDIPARQIEMLERAISDELGGR